MSVYTSCAYESTRKDLARNIFMDLNNAGIPTFFTADIPDDIRSNIRSETIAAMEQAAVFVPILCDAYEQNYGCHRELIYAFSMKKMIVPVMVESGVSIGTLLMGTRISDVSSPAKYEAELPELIKTIRPLIPEIVVSYKVKHGRTAGLAAGNQDA